MALSAEYMARGDFSHSVDPARGLDELSILAQAFETMRLSVESHINAERESANFERGLLQERMENLRMRHLLEQAEFQALQAQINPHFLFNTLHTGIQLAVIEDADQTRSYIENLAAVFKHNLRRLDRPVYLAEEISSIERYIAIMRIRFGDRFCFSVNYPQPLPHLTMPAMILQPLVENAINHGLKDCTEGGAVWINVDVQGLLIHLEVKDNGTGIPPAILSKICADNQYDMVDTENALVSDPTCDEGRKSNGIGLRNVLDRMTAFYGGSKMWRIESSAELGTTIHFLVPWQGEEHV
jgi:sensor histidine kinase YesM